MALRKCGRRAIWGVEMFLPHDLGRCGFNCTMGTPAHMALIWYMCVSGLELVCVIHVLLCTCMCVEVRGQCQTSLLCNHLLCFLRQSLSLPWRLLRGPDWMVGSLLPLLKNTSSPGLTYLSYGNWTQDLELVSQSLPLPNEPSKLKVKEIFPWR